jgi:hypothetical protein
MRIVVYDAEILNAIPDKGSASIEGITYAKNWGDHVGMGVSVITAYVWEHGYRVFLADNFATFKELAEDPETLCVGYNNRVFDDLLLERALGITIPVSRSYDLLRAVKVARGQNPAGVGGPSLGALCEANFLPGKNGTGAFAPILWQKGKIGQVIDYCLNDTAQTVRLLELVLAGRLRDPDSGRILSVSQPLMLASDEARIE